MSIAKLDAASEAAILNLTSEAAKRDEIRSRLGIGTLSFSVYNPDKSEIVSGEFSGTEMNSTAAFLSDVTLSNVTGTGGTPDNTWEMEIKNTTGTSIKLAKDCWTFVGPNNTAVIDTADTLSFSVTYINEVIPSNYPLISLTDFINNQKLDSLVQPGFGTHNNPNGVIRTANYAAIQGFMSGQDQTFVDEVQEMYPWLFCYPGVGHTFGQGYRLQFRRLLVAHKNNNGWNHRGPYPFLRTSTLEWNGNTQGSVASGKTADDGDGITSFTPTQMSDGIEIWSDVLNFRDRNIYINADAWAGICEARIVDSAGNPYYGSDAAFVCQLGYDVYGIRSGASSDLPGTGTPINYPRWRADGGSGAYVDIGGDWTPVTFNTMQSIRQNENQYDNYNSWIYDLSPYTQTEAEVRNSFPDFVLNDSSGGGGGGGTSNAGIFGEYVTADPNYTPTAAPGDVVETLMATTDTPFRLGKMFTGWHRDNTFTFDPYVVPHQRLHDWKPSNNADDGGAFWAKIHYARHYYDWSRFDEAIKDNNGCPKNLLVYLTPAWAVSQANKDEVVYRYGPENFFGQIFYVTRYPTYPYSAHPPEDWTVLTEYIQAIYRSKNVLGPGGEPGGGYTEYDIPVIELQNEQKYAAKTPNAGRWWDNPLMPFYPTDNHYSTKDVNGPMPYSFNLHTMQEDAIKARIVKAAVPPGVQVWTGGWEGDSQGKTLANPSADYSFFQAWALSSDGAGGYGIDHVDAIAFHPYMFGYDPERVLVEIKGYRDQLIWLADYLGRPALADLPIHANETGHESPSGVKGSFGSGTWIIENGPGYNGQAGNTTIARDLGRSNLIVAGSASVYKILGITNYKDVPWQLQHGTTHARQTYGAVTETPEIYNVQTDLNRLVGRVVRQAYIRSGGSVWLETEDNIVMEY